MFKTAPKIQIRNPQRNAFTACAKTSKRVKIALEDHANQQDQGSRTNRVRPLTTPLAEPKNYSSLQSTTRSTHFVNVRSIGAVETELQDQYQGDMCGYLRTKLRKLVGKKQEEIGYNRYLQSTIQNEIQATGKSSFLGPLDQFYSTFKHKNRLKIEKGVDQVYLFNAKERISRLIEKKRQSEHDFSEVKCSVRSKRMHHEELQGKSFKSYFKVGNVEEEEWDRDWRNESRKQTKRYRNRLIAKHNRQNLTLTLH